MEIEVIFEKTTAVQSGTSNSGKDWVKGGFIGNTEEKYSKMIFFEVWGDKVEALNNLTAGEKVKVFVELESKEWQGKYFTACKAWKIEQHATAVTGTWDEVQRVTVGKSSIPSTTSITTQKKIVDDLPF